jgi:hypothetical protein
LDALDRDRFRLLDVAGWALLFAGMILLLAVMEWLKPRWAESLAFGVGLGLLGLVGDLGRGDGFDWIYVMLSLVGGTVGWFTLLWLGERFSRWAKKYGERHVG